MRLRIMPYKKKPESMYKNRVSSNNVIFYCDFFNLLPGTLDVNCSKWVKFTNFFDVFRLNSHRKTLMLTQIDVCTILTILIDIFIKKCRKTFVHIHCVIFYPIKYYFDVLRYSFYSRFQFELDESRFDYVYFIPHTIKHFNSYKGGKKLTEKIVMNDRINNWLKLPIAAAAAIQRQQHHHHHWRRH